MRRRTSPRSSRVARGCASSPPAARRSRSAPRPSSACRRSSYPRPAPRRVEALRRCPSVALFVQRAAKVKPGFALSEANAAPIAEICRRLDGLPLALELAAARARILEPAALLQRLDHALDLLTSGDRDLPLRQRTLRAAISWSYSLLDAQEQRLLRRLSCFHEGWTLEAMEQVCYAADERPRALDELDSLVEKGLVRVVDGSGRYGLLETIRAFAAEQLHASGEVETTRRAHADHFVAFAERVAFDLRTPGQIEAMRRAHRDDANSHAAIGWLTACARAGDSEALEQALLLCGHQDWFWHISGQHQTARWPTRPCWRSPPIGRRAGAARSRGSGPAWSRPRPTSGSARSASGPAASRTAKPWGRRGSRPRAGWAWATAT